MSKLAKVIKEDAEACRSEMTELYKKREADLIQRISDMDSEDQMCYLSEFNEQVFLERTRLWNLEAAYATVGSPEEILMYNEANCNKIFEQAMEIKRLKEDLDEAIKALKDQ